MNIICYNNYIVKKVKYYFIFKIKFLIKICIVVYKNFKKIKKIILY